MVVARDTCGGSFFHTSAGLIADNARPCINFGGFDVETDTCRHRNALGQADTRTNVDTTAHSDPMGQTDTRTGHNTPANDHPNATNTHTGSADTNGNNHTVLNSNTATDNHAGSANAVSGRRGYHGTAQLGSGL